ncbi:MAG: 50S ribosomal protein L21 [Pseudomonadota bacterium]|jgi:large subunit ribosomal protein L21
MYAVIQTGGKQYRVQPGDLLVVEKLDGDVGAKVAFDQVLLVGGEGQTVVGAPLVDGGVVHATLVETRKGEKVRIFKKIRRHGYRRTRGHRQFETVLRVTGLAGGGLEANWDGVVDLTPKAVLDARARGLAPRGEAVEVAAEAAPAPAVEEAAPKKTRAKKVEAEEAVTAAEAAQVEAAPEAAAEEAAAPKKTRAKKAKADDAAADDSEA